MTGIGRMLSGIVDALAECAWVKTITLATGGDVIPACLRRSPVASIMLPKSFVRAEWALSKLTQKGYDVFMSPYPKLPLFGVHCLSVHTIHDVLDLRNPFGRIQFKTFIDTKRLGNALQCSDMTWYDSAWSMKETEALIGFKGRDPRVRHLGIDQRFTEAVQGEDRMVLEKYGLPQEYILIVGNGLPHKNIGLLLKTTELCPRILVFVGVPRKNRNHWKGLDRTNRSIWIETVRDEDMPPLMRQAYCLFQPSLVEGYGYPPLEAMACGTPAVVSDIPVLVETTGGNALVADPRDGESWVAAYRHLEEEAVYHALVEKGLLWVAHLRGRQGWIRHMDDIEELMGRGQE